MSSLLLVMSGLSFALLFKGLHSGLTALILVEMLTLIMFLSLVTECASTSSLALASCLFFVITTASASMGLSLLVALARSHGASQLAPVNI